VTLPRVVCLSRAVGSDTRPAGDHRPQGLWDEKRKRHMHDQEANDHRHPCEMQHPRSLEAAK
jgi:hypothetical protein